MSKILIVDDVRDNRETLKRVLSRLGHTSDVACDVEEAVQKVEAGAFHLVLMDITIPQSRDGELDIYGGIEATKRIRSNPRFRDLPIVAVTAHGFHSQRKAILDSGCCEILEKGPEGFIGRTREMLERILGPSPIASVKPPASTASQATPTATSTNTSTSTNTNSAPAPKPTERLIPVPKVQVTAAPTQSQLSLSAVDLKVLESILQQLVRARHSLGVTLAQIEQQDVDAELLTSLQKLDRDLNRAQTRFETGPGPRPGESLAHWGINGITSLGIDCETLRAFQPSPDDAIGKIIEQVQICLRTIEAALKNHQYSSLESPADKIIPSSTSAVASPSGASVSNTTGPSVAATQAMEPLAKLSTTHSEHTPKVLVVDDDGEIRLSMERMLIQLGLEAYSCGDGMHALRMLESQAFDLCLLDLNMPGLGGLELIKRIRSTPALSQIPIIVISGSGQLEAAAEAIEIGADDYLTKPPHRPLLRARITACLKQLDLRRAELAKFLPQSVIKASLNNPERMYSGRLADVSVLFADIRNFSRISDRIGAQETIRWIRDVMDRLSTCILSHDGTLVDYVGDEIIAMWGAPQESESHAQQACRCALSIQNETVQLSKDWQDRLGEPFQLGIGIHSGPAVVGNMASNHRFKYGPFGPTVNIASRVQGATKYLRTNILITSALAQMLPSEFAKRRLCKVQVKNIPTPMDLFELRQPESQSHERDSHYEEALRAFESRDFSTAMRRLASLLNEYPEDGPTQLLMNRLIQCQLENEEFSSVWILPGK